MRPRPASAAHPITKRQQCDGDGSAQASEKLRENGVEYTPKASRTTAILTAARLNRRSGVAHGRGGSARPSTGRTTAPSRSKCSTAIWLSRSDSRWTGLRLVGRACRNRGPRSATSMTLPPARPRSPGSARFAVPKCFAQFCIASITAQASASRIDGGTAAEPLKEMSFSKTQDIRPRRPRGTAISPCAAAPAQQEVPRQRSAALGES